MTDPIVEEVRARRMEHTREFGSDLSAICADLRSKQATSGYRIVKLAPKKLEPSKASTKYKKPSA